MSTAATARHVPQQPVAHVAAGWLVMAIDDIRVVLPQKDVREISLAVDLTPSTDGDEAEIGWLERESGESWPAYCLDSSLAFLGSLPSRRRFCVFFEQAGGVIGLVCDRLSSLATDEEIQVQTLPGCMGGRRTPIVGVAHHDAGLVTVTSAADLASYLEFLKEHRDGGDE